MAYNQAKDPNSNEELIVGLIIGILLILSYQGMILYLAYAK